MYLVSDKDMSKLEWTMMITYISTNYHVKWDSLGQCVISDNGNNDTQRVVIGILPFTMHAKSLMKLFIHLYILFGITDITSNGVYLPSLSPSTVLT